MMTRSRLDFILLLCGWMLLRCETDLAQHQCQEPLRSVFDLCHNKKQGMPRLWCSVPNPYRAARWVVWRAYRWCFHLDSLELAWLFFQLGSWSASEIIFWVCFSLQRPCLLFFLIESCSTFGKVFWYVFLFFGGTAFVRWQLLICYLYSAKRWLTFEVWERCCRLGGDIFKILQIFDPNELVLVFDMDLIDSVAVKSY